LQLAPDRIARVVAITPAPPSGAGLDEPPAAAAKYVDLWGYTDISQGVHGIATPMLIIAAAHDAPPFQPAALQATLRGCLPALFL
jgi:hypothetical protein